MWTYERCDITTDIWCVVSWCAAEAVIGCSVSPLIGSRSDCRSVSSGSLFSAQTAVHQLCVLYYTSTGFQDKNCLWVTKKSSVNLWGTPRHTFPRSLLVVCQEQGRTGDVTAAWERSTGDVLKLCDNMMRGPECTCEAPWGSALPVWATGSCSCPICTLWENVERSTFQDVISPLQSDIRVPFQIKYLQSDIRVPFKVKYLQSDIRVLWLTSEGTDLKQETKKHKSSLNKQVIQDYLDKNLKSV